MKSFRLWGLVALLFIAAMVPLGSQATPARSFELYIAQGNDPAYSWVDKFAVNGTLETGTVPEDIWEHGGMLTLSDYGVFPDVGVADINSCSSSNDTDNQLLGLQGLDVDGFEVSVPVQLDGQTRVVLPTLLWRLYRIQNEADAGGEISGTVYCYAGTEETAGVPDGASVVKAIVDDGNNQTQMSQYIVPRGKVGFLLRGEIGLDFSQSGPQAGSQSAVLQYQSRRYGKVFKVKKTVSLITSGTSVYSDYRVIPDPIPALTDIKITALDVSATMGVWATFDILLVDESALSAGYLASIGQPFYP